MGMGLVFPSAQAEDAAGAAVLAESPWLVLSVCPRQCHQGPPSAPSSGLRSSGGTGAVVHYSGFAFAGGTRLLRQSWACERRHEGKPVQPTGASAVMFARLPGGFAAAAAGGAPAARCGHGAAPGAQGRCPPEPRAVPERAGGRRRGRAAPGSACLGLCSRRAGRRGGAGPVRPPRPARRGVRLRRARAARGAGGRCRCRSRCRSRPGSLAGTAGPHARPPAGALGAARRSRRLTGATFHKTAPAIGSLPGVSLQRSPRLARGGAAARPRAGTRPRRPQP